MKTIRPLNHAFLALLLLALAGCQTNPVSEAKSPEQRAYAIAGTYAISQSRVLDILAQPQTSDALKSALKQADATASPVVLQLIDATKLYANVKAELAGTEGDARLETAAANLETWLTRAKPLVDNLIATLEH
jgi:hypothetical protein